MSKVLSTMGGGLIVTHNAEIAELIANIAEDFHPQSLSREMVVLTKCAILSLVTRSNHLGPVAAIWNNVRGKSDLEDFETTQYTTSQAALCRVLLRRLSDINATRQQNAAYLGKELAGLAGIALPIVLPEAEPICLRLPLVVDDLCLKALLLSRLKIAGICVSEMYAPYCYKSLCSVAERPAACPNTEYLAPRMLVLPTHAYLSGSDLEHITACFREAL
jgi:dTDP-4-amino-4,6-dideoxygalactose transaminase